MMGNQALPLSAREAAEALVSYLQPGDCAEAILAGQAARDVVQQYQRAMGGIAADGVPGPATRDRAEALLGAGQDWPPDVLAQWPADAPPALLTKRILSPGGLAFLQRHEGLRLKLYNDSKGFATIGYGHLVHLGPMGEDPEIEAPFVNGISQAQAATLLRIDVKGAELAVRRWCRSNLAQHEFDALVSFAFNVGGYALEMSTLRTRVNSLATPDAIVSAFMLFREPPEVIPRRRAEANLFCQGDYGLPVS